MADCPNCQVQKPKIPETARVCHPTVAFERQIKKLNGKMQNYRLKIKERWLWRQCGVGFVLFCF
jgi:hypothetical protein